MIREVNPRLYWGDYDGAMDSAALGERGVTHVLTVDSESLPWQDDGCRAKLTFLFCRTEDSPTWDLLSDLEACVAFIDAGMKAGAVLVHCHAGLSRSAAVVAAFLVSRRGLPLAAAVARLRALDPRVSINPGFEHQLSVYEASGCTCSGLAYRQHRLQRALALSPDVPALPAEAFVDDPEERQRAAGTVPGGVYKCRKCRRSLFHGTSVVTHRPGPGATAFHQRGRRSGTAAAPNIGGTVGGSLCSSLFVEPVRWMEKELLGVMEGPLRCPQCQGKVGSFSWRGQRCSCGVWVTPAFQLHRTRLDETGTAPRVIALHGV